MSKIKSLVAVTAAAGLVLSGVTASQAATKSITIGLIADLTSWAASSSQFGNLNLPYQAVYDSLLVATPDGAVKPNVATSYKYDKAGTTLTLKIRQGIKYTDGTALDAANVVKNLVAFQKGDSPDASNISSMVSAA
ncbi:MAG: hypothetical protein RL243_886, partial [Actinomycetota bacterium]